MVAGLPQAGAIQSRSGNPQSREADGSVMNHGVFSHFGPWSITRIPFKLPN